MSQKPLISLFSLFFALYVGILLLSPSSLIALRDLEEKISPFFLSSQQIHIEGHLTAFNPSIVRWQDKILLSFRMRHPLTKSTHQMGLIWLDKNFSPISDPQTIDIFHPTAIPRSQDPRLIVVNDRLWMAFNDVCILESGAENRRMAYSELSLNEEGRWSASPPTYLLDFEGCLPKRQEKNWPPFDYEGHLLFSYSIAPHRVLYPVVDSSHCETIALTQNDVRWNWGVLRGGTPALQIDDEYLAFFHCVKDMTTCQSQGERMDHYFMGAYTFSAIPPFHITRISPEPIWGKDFYNGPMHNTWKPLRVVFPGGYIYDQEHIWVVYGKQDHEIWVACLDRKGLFDSLLPVETTP